TRMPTLRGHVERRMSDRALPNSEAASSAAFGLGLKPKERKTLFHPSDGMSDGRSLFRSRKSLTPATDVEESDVTSSAGSATGSPPGEGTSPPRLNRSSNFSDDRTSALFAMSPIWGT